MFEHYYKFVLPSLDEKRRIFCKDARDIAKEGCGLKSMRSALKTYKVDVKYCQLGCFKEKKGKQFIVRTKTWIENADGDLLFGRGKTELLELIGQTGSLLHASKLMGINYKKAWMHLQTENLDLEQVQDLSKNLSNLSRRLNESLKELEPYTQNAKLNQAELKNLEHKLNLSTKDLAQIKPKTEQDIAESLHHDVKSTLLQISNLAKNEGNEAVYNQANRLLAQIEINQLMSLANDSINTYLPFSWDDLNDSKIMFRRGKKDKFFAQIKLEFAKLGDLEILISLNNEKYIDINIMAENIEFRKTIYENAHELKRNINKAGLLSANFFVGDIIRSKFDTRNMKNLDLEMGMDKKV